MAGDDGRIYSYVVKGYYDYSRPPKVLKPYTGKTNDYRLVALRRNGLTVQRTVHTLVCEAFHGPRPDGMTASHLNGDCADNRPENLRWETLKENHARKVAHGTDHRGYKNSRALFNTENLLDIRRRLLAGETAREIADRYDCDDRAIGKIKRGERYAGL
jgi:hypothetical protein